MKSRLRKKINSYLKGTFAASVVVFGSNAFAEPEESAATEGAYSPSYMDLRSKELSEDAVLIHAMGVTAKSQGIAIVYFADGKAINPKQPWASEYSAHDGDIFKEIRQYAIELHNAGENFDRIVIAKSRTGKDHAAVIIRGHNISSIDQVGANGHDQGGLIKALRETVPDSIKTAEGIENELYPKNGETEQVLAPSAD